MNGYSGQNFLIGKKKIKEVVNVLDLKFNDTVIEIGAGHGEITTEIIKKFKDLKIKRFRIVAIEKDKNLAEDLRFKIYDLRLGKNIEIIEGDALKILKFYILHLKSYKLVGNIPFYITGHLLRIVSQLKLKPELAVFIIQKEVAQRIISGPPQMNLLAASVGFWLEPKIIGYISKKEFKPAPQVDAAIIKLETRDKRQAIRDKTQAAREAERYYKLIRIIFKQPRKTILNNLAISDKRQVINKEEIIKKLVKIGVNPQSRPQNLEIKQLRQLSTLF